MFEGGTNFGFWNGKLLLPVLQNLTPTKSSWGPPRSNINQTVHAHLEVD